MSKLMVLDTNVLLSNNNCLRTFDEHSVAIPLTVLEELDNQKSRKDDLAVDARAAIRTLEEIINESGGDVLDGVVINKEFPDAKLYVINEAKQTPHFNITNNDDKIINCALCCQYDNNGFEWETQYDEVVLVSNDVNMRLKARGAGVTCTEPYRCDKVVDDIDVLSPGYHEAPDGWMGNLDPSVVKSKSCGGLVLPARLLPFPVTIYEDNGEVHSTLINEWIYNEKDDYAASVTGVGIDDDGEPFVEMTVKGIKNMMNRNCSGIKAKSVFQSMAIDVLLDRDIDIVVLSGAAGSGKTLLAIAAGCEMIKGKKRYGPEEIIFTKSMDHGFEDIGFLPGNEHEKMMPWTMAVFDNLEVLSRESKMIELHPEHSIEGDDAFIKINSMNFMRGRSLHRRLLIIDEAQNLTSKQLRTVLSRAGEDTKVVLMGNVRQIDNTYISANSSGLTYCVSKFSQWERAATIHLEGVERSPLAGFVEANFD